MFKKGSVPLEVLKNQVNNILADQEIKAKKFFIEDAIIEYLNEEFEWDNSLG